MRAGPVPAEGGVQDALGRMAARSEESVCFAAMQTGTAHLAVRPVITLPERACKAQEVHCAPATALQLGCTATTTCSAVAGVRSVAEPHCALVMNQVLRAASVLTLQVSGRLEDLPRLTVIALPARCGWMQPSNPRT